MTCLLHCSVNSDNSLHFFVKNIQVYLITFPLKCVITLIQSAFLPSHQSLTSVFEFLLSFIQLQEKNKQLSDELEHDIMNCQCQGLMLRQITQTRGLIIHVIMRKPIEFNNCFVMYFLTNLKRLFLGRYYDIMSKGGKFLKKLWCWEIVTE